MAGPDEPGPLRVGVGTAEDSDSGRATTVLSFPESIVEIQFETVFAVDSPGREKFSRWPRQATSLIAVASEGISGLPEGAGSITSGHGLIAFLIENGADPWSSHAMHDTYVLKAKKAQDHLTENFPPDRATSSE